MTALLSGLFACLASLSGPQRLLLMDGCISITCTTLSTLDALSSPASYAFILVGSLAIRMFGLNAR